MNQETAKTGMWWDNGVEDGVVSRGKASSCGSLANIRE